MLAVVSIFIRFSFATKEGNELMTVDRETFVVWFVFAMHNGHLMRVENKLNVR